MQLLDCSKLVTLVAGKWRRLLFMAEDNEVFLTRSLNVVPKITAMHCWSYYWQTRSIVQPLCDRWATCWTL